MPTIIQDFEKFIEETRDLYELIETARAKRIGEHQAINSNLPARISFEELDLYSLKKRLLSIHKTLQWRGHNNRLFRLHRTTFLPQARTVAIAGVCELIKDEYVGKFWNLHTRVVGWGPDSTLYDWVWEKGFQDNGIEMICSDYRREFVQTLVLESGVPRSRAKEIVEFFVLYWRYLRDFSDIESIIDDLKNGDFQGAYIPAHDRNRLEGICRDAAEFSKAFALAVCKLSRIFSFIETSPEILGGSIEDHIPLIRQKTGLSPLEVLRDAEQLRKIYQMILGLVTPHKLLQILQSRPPGTKILIPDGLTLRLDNYTDLQYGIHVLQGVKFTCVPVAGVGLDFVDGLPFNRVVRSGNEIYLKSKALIEVTLGKRFSPDLVRQYYRPEFYGYVFYTRLQPGIPVTISTDDGYVNEIISPDDGFHCEPWIQYSGNPGKNIHRIYTGFSKCQILSTEHPDSRLPIYVGDARRPLARLKTDSAGYAYCTERESLLKNPAPGEIVFRATDPHTKETISTSTGKAESILKLPDALLFHPYAGWLLKPFSEGRSRRFGCNTFVLLTASNGPDNLELQNISTVEEGTLGDYAVRALKWQDVNKPSGIKYIHGTETFNWQFEKCLHFNLYLNRKNDPSPTGIELTSQQGLSLTDFSVALNPAPSEEVRTELFWSLIVNGSVPTDIPFADGPLGHVDGPSQKFSGEDLKALVSSALVRFAGQGAASVELSLCSRDNIFSTIRFWVLPNLRMSVPSGLQNGDEFIVTVEASGGIRHNVLMEDVSGNSLVHQKITFENGDWQLVDEEHAATLELEEIGTSINLKARPPIAGFRIGDRAAGNVGPVRDLFRRELGALDLLGLGSSKNSMQVFIDGYEAPLVFRHSDKIRHVPLTTLPGLRKEMHVVKLVDADFSNEFRIRYRVALISADFHKNLIDGNVHGRIDYRGPIGSSLVFMVYSGSQSGAATLVGSTTVSCDGNEHEDYPLEVVLGVTGDAVKQFRVELLFHEDGGGRTFTHKYGETWHVHSGLENGDLSAEFLIDQTKKAIVGAQYFMARRCLEKAIALGGANDTTEARELWKAVEAGILETTLHDIAAQTSRVIRKEFLLDTSTFNNKARGPHD